MKPAPITDDHHQHQLGVLRTRRKALRLWLVLAIACVSAAIAVSILLPLLERDGLTWVLGLFVLSIAGFIYVIHHVDRTSKALWPSGRGDIAGAVKSTSPRSGV